MDLDAATDELYAGAPDDFIDRRKALVAQARSAKDRPLATAIGKLRRPTKSAWLVNLLAREDPEQVTAVLELGQVLQAAQAQPSAPELRRLSGERQTTLAAATRRAAALGEAHGYTATEAVRQEVSQTLQAALVESGVADEVRRGVVAEAHAYGGFGVFGLAPAPVPTADEAAAADESGANQKVADEEASTEDRERTAAEERLQDAEAALSAAAEEADAATEQADELAERVESLRAELAEAEEAEATARREARGARKKVGELEARAREARQAYDALR